MENLINGRKAIITGASGGIGRNIALELAKEKAKLALFGRNIEKLNEIAKQVEELSGTAPILMCGDLCNGEFVKKAVNEVATELGGVDILINNAGVAQSAKVEDITEKEYDLIMNTNVKAPFLLCKQTLPFLKESESATIINIASVTAHKGYPMQSIYTASKHALIGFSKAFAKEVYQEGVRVHVISPGGVFTDMIKISRPDLTSEGMIMPEDISDIILFLLKHRNNAVIDEICVHRAAKEPFI